MEKSTSYVIVATWPFMLKCDPSGVWPHGLHHNTAPRHHAAVYTAIFATWPCIAQYYFRFAGIVATYLTPPLYQIQEEGGGGLNAGIVARHSLRFDAETPWMPAYSSRTPRLVIGLAGFDWPCVFPIRWLLWYLLEVEHFEEHPKIAWHDWLWSGSAKHSPSWFARRIHVSFPMDTLYTIRWWKLLLSVLNFFVVGVGRVVLNGACTLSGVCCASRRRGSTGLGFSWCTGAPILATDLFANLWYSVLLSCWLWTSSRKKALLDWMNRLRRQGAILDRLGVIPEVE